MHVFMHGVAGAGFDVLKAKIKRDMAGPAGNLLINIASLILVLVKLCFAQR